MALELLTITIVAVCPSATPLVVPLMAKPAAASAALTTLSPAIGLVIAIVGTTVSSVKAKGVTADTLPATSVCRTSMVLAPCTSCAAVGALVDQVVPPSSEYSTFAPVSMPVSVSAGLLVMWSLFDDPLSPVSATPGATGSTVSSVKAKAVTPDTLPATSVCRTSTVLAPCTSCAAVGALVDQVVPPSSEYSTFAPVSMPVSVSAGLLVMWSLFDVPVSPVSATPGATGTTVSSVKAKGVIADTLPATSVCRTSMVLAPCTSCAAVGALVDQVVPPSSEYSTLAPGSMLLSVSAGLLVMWSLFDVPRSLVSATPWAIWCT